ncbi:hypothetical protein [Rudanella paleaurantiibacter]|uniref:hypothetical protein n=1 Tax=Rudanella paleaurantiibacter TaxID=2614655 RepID=UPI001FE4D060|nr:hypothetical protein [Rudanella paleaurantiibacter]
MLFRLILIVCLLACHYANAQSVTVSGAGNAAYNTYSLNGTYQFDGQQNGKNRYRKSSGFTANGCQGCSGSAAIFWNGSAWILQATGSGQCVYCAIPTTTHSSTAVTATNPPCTGWTNGMTLTGACENGSTPCTAVSIVVTGQPGQQQTNPAQVTVSLGSSLTLSATGCSAGTVRWSTNDTSPVVEVSPTVSTTYSVTCTSTACPSPSEQRVAVSVVLPALPSPVIGQIPAEWCRQEEFAVPYSVSVTHPSGNRFRVQLSDSLGSWRAPLVIGTVLASGSGVIRATIPRAVLRANGYRLRVVATLSSQVDTVGVPIRVVSLCVTTCDDMVSVRSGNWHDPDTWSCGRVPGGADNVTISTDHIVTVADNRTVVCQNIQQNGTLTLGTGSRLRLLGDDEGSTQVQGTLVLKPNVFGFDPANNGQIIARTPMTIRFRGVPAFRNIGSMSAGGRLAAKSGLFEGEWAVFAQTTGTPFGFIGQVTSTRSLSTTNGDIETEITFEPGDLSDITKEADISWQAVLKKTMQTQFTGQFKGKQKVETAEDTERERDVEINVVGTATDSLRVTMDFGLKVANSNLSEFRCMAQVENNLRLRLKATGKITYKEAIPIDKWERKAPYIRFVFIGGVPVPIVFRPTAGLDLTSELEAEIGFDGELLNTTQRVGIGKLWRAGQGWSDITLPSPLQHPDKPLELAVKGKAQIGLKPKAGVKFYEQDNWKVEVGVEGYAALEGTCNFNNTGLIVSSAIGLKPELEAEFVWSPIVLEGRVAMDLDSIPLGQTPVNVDFCRLVENCIDRIENNYAPRIHRQIVKDADNRIQKIRTFLTDSGIQETVFSYNAEGKVIGADLYALGDGSSPRVLSPTNSQTFVYGTNQIEQYFYTTSSFSGVRSVLRYKLSESGQITHIQYRSPAEASLAAFSSYSITLSYYPNGYLQTARIVYGYGGWMEKRYTYNEAEGTVICDYDDPGDDLTSVTLVYDTSQKQFGTELNAQNQESGGLGFLKGYRFLEDLGRVIDIEPLETPLIHQGKFYFGAPVISYLEKYADPSINFYAERGYTVDYSYDTDGKPISFTRTEYRAERNLNGTWESITSTNPPVPILWKSCQ